MAEEVKRVTAFDLHKARVFTRDKQMLGIIVNIIIDSKIDFGTRLLIFPKERPWWEDWLTKEGQEITMDLIQRALPDKTDQILKDIAEKGPDVALGFWKEYLKRRKCYLISLLEMDHIEIKKVNEIVLKKDQREIEKSYDDFQTYEGEVAFYPENAISNEENKTLLPITLNLPCFKGQPVTDPEDKKGRIFNIQLDAKKGQVSHLIVQTSGDCAGNHIISSKDFDWSSFDIKTNLATAPLCE